ncbi:MFS transporter [Bacillus pseudomycoides]|uniref:MFS transporter n=1 Tax=Bacillus pseudomycoides TaxID=64104 RepID=UPI001FB269AC|nr:MFS transporter [Bacillus pseudomycoides]
MYKTILKNKNVMYYLLGGGVSSLGDILTGLAFVFLAYDLTGSELYTTGMVIATTVPYLLFGLVGGVIADWVQKKKLLIMIDIIRIPLTLSLVFCYYFDVLTYTYMIIISFFIQCCGCFFNPAHRALLPMIIPMEQRNMTNSLYDSITRGITVLSPFFSVLLMKTVGVIHFFTIDAITYFISALFLVQMNVTEDVMATKRKHVKEVFLSLREFWIWMKSNRQITFLFLLTFTMVFMNTWVWKVGLLVSLGEFTKDSKEVYSVIQGFFGCIIIITNMIIPFIWKELDLTIYIIASIIWGIGIFLLGFTFNISFYFVGVCIVGIGLPLAGLTRVYILQKLVPKDMLGRGFSFNAVLLYLADTISLFVFGILSIFISIHVIFIICGIGMMIMSIALKFLVFRRQSVKEEAKLMC